MTKPPPTKRATLRDVAAMAGVSVASASRALDGHSYVSSEMKERVEQAARELDYHPDDRGRSLRTSRSMTLGLVCYQLRQLPMLDFIDGFGARANDAGYAVVVANARGDDNQYQTLLRRLFERRLDGVVVTSPGDLGDALRPYLESGIPVALTLWRSSNESQLPLITTSEMAAVRQAMARLLELGHRSVVYFGTQRSVRMQRPGYLTAAAAEHDMSSQMAFLPEGIDAELMAQHLSHAMESPTNATAVAVNQSLVGPLLGAVRLLRLRIPEDLSVFTFTDYEPTSAFLDPPLSSVHDDVAEMGRRSAELLTRWIDTGEAPPNTTTFDLSSWRETSSIGPAPTLRTTQ